MDLRSELEEVRLKANDINSVELIACHRALIQARLRRSNHKQIVVTSQFSEGYPVTPLLVELKSKTLPEKLLRGMEDICDKELKQRSGNPQVLVLLRFLSEFLASNPLIACSEEVTYIKNSLFREGDDLKVKHRTGIIHYKACDGRYFMDLRLTVPNEYPERPVELDIKECNLPPNLLLVVRGHSIELLRQCVEPPLRKRKPTDPPFSPQPSLRVIADYLVLDCLRRLPTECCHVCKKPALPDNPQDAQLDESDPKFVHRVYCSHLYHYACLDSYMKQPPFTGGKKCLKCGQRIFHDKWNVAPKVAEERWAHQEARKREIAEVADFLGFD